MRLLTSLVRPATNLLHAARGGWQAGTARLYGADAVGLTDDQLEFQHIAQACGCMLGVRTV